MANYFPVVLTGTTRSWLMNLPEGNLTSWHELCCQFMVNFESAYSQPGNETDLHTIQQHRGETLCSFIQRFSQVCNTIPRISNASVVVGFRQCVKDEKMLEKLTTHDIKDVVELFRLTDKCVRAVEGQAWHAPPALEVGKDGQPNTGAAVQGGGSKNNNKKKDDCNNQPLVGAPTTVAAAAAGWGRGPRGDKRPRQTSDSDDGGAQCPVHNSVCHNARECREIKKLTAQYREQLKQQQQREDGAPSL
jgi:hypothetical protein